MIVDFKTLARAACMTICAKAKLPNELTLKCMHRSWITLWQILFVNRRPIRLNKCFWTGKNPSRTLGGSTASLAVDLTISQNSVSHKKDRHARRTKGAQTRSIFILFQLKVSELSWECAVTPNFHHYLWSSIDLGRTYNVGLLFIVSSYVLWL